MSTIIGPTVLGIGTILVSSMFAVLKSLDGIHPIVRASWRLQTTFLALAAPSAISRYLDITRKNGGKPVGRNYAASYFLPPVTTAWSGCGYALYNVGLCIALAKTSLLRASILSQCAPLFIVLHNVFRSRCYHPSRGQLETTNSGGGEEEEGATRWEHMLGVVLTLVGTGIYISSTTAATESGVDESEPSGIASSPTTDFGSHILGDVAAIAASAGYAMYLSCSRRAQRVVPVYVHLPGCVLVATILVSTLGELTLNTHASYGDDIHFCSSLLGWTCIEYLPRNLFLGVVCGAVAVGMINWSLNHVSALQAAAASSAEPIAASIIGVVFFAEPAPNSTAVIAAGIIVLAMLLCSADYGTTNTTTSKKDTTTHSIC